MVVFVCVCVSRLGGIEHRATVESLVISTRVHDRWTRTVVDLLGCHGRSPGEAVVGHHLVLVGLEVHLLLIGHQVGNGEGVVEVIVGVQRLEGIAL